jgi:hypothetical protein
VIYLAFDRLSKRTQRRLDPESGSADLADNPA